MAKLNAKDRKKVDKSEAVTGEFKPMPPGKYVAELAEVETRVSGKGNAYWNAEFNNIHSLDGDKQPGRLWYMIMLPVDKMPADYKADDPNLTDEQRKEKWDNYQSLTAGRIKAFFEAFGYSLDSDTDEMIGDRVILQVGIETQQQGANAGQQRNRVNAVLPLDDVDIEFGDDEDGDDDF